MRKACWSSGIDLAGGYSASQSAAERSGGWNERFIGGTLAAGAPVMAFLLSERETRTTAEPPVRRLGGRGAFVASELTSGAGVAEERGPVALRPRLSPGVPLTNR